MVPVAVHQVLSGVCLRLVEGRIAVGRDLQRTVYGAEVHDVGLVRGELELTDAGGDIADLDLLSELVALKGSFPYLASLKEIDLLAVEGPSGVGDAFGITGELDLIRTVDVAHEEVAAAPVVRYGSIADTVQDLGPVGGELWV